MFRNYSDMLRIPWYQVILSIAPHGTGDSAEAVDNALGGAALDYCHDHSEDCVDGHPRLPSRALDFLRLFFKLPPLPQTDSALAGRSGKPAQR